MRSTRSSCSPSHAVRAGFTLVELLVVMFLILFLSAMVMVVAPDIMDKDRASDSAVQVQGALQNARARAMRDGYPRGVRFIVNTAANPLSTEYQFIESPPVLILNTDGPGQNPPYAARVLFNYVLANNNTISSRSCSIQNLTAAQLGQIQVGATMSLPVLGTFHVITGTGGATAQTAASGLDPSKFSMTLSLDQYPDAQMGAGGIVGGGFCYATTHFGFYTLPRPLLGEPTVQMPTNSCIDLNVGVSSPAYPSPAGAADYDVLFAPSGQLLNFGAGAGGAGQVFLWVRDPGKGIATASYPSAPYSMKPSDLGGSYTTAQYNAALKAGGEQLLVVIKSKSGATGVAPVYWPDASSSDVYLFARKVASGP